MLEKHNFIDSYRFINKTIKYDNFGYNIDGATCNLNKKDEPPIRIDFIYTKNIEITDSKVLITNISDHIPLITNILIQQYNKNENNI